MNKHLLSRRNFLKGSGAAVGGLFGSSLLNTVAMLSAQGEVPELEPAELVFFLGGNPEEIATRQRIMDAFTELHPQVTFKISEAGADPVQKLLTEFAGGAQLDVIMAWELSYPGLGDRGVFMDLNPLIEADADYSTNVIPDIVPDLLNMFNWNGQQLVLPEQFAGVVLYYNKDLFDEAGIEYPPADWTNTDWTFERFLEVAQALTKTDENGQVSQFGFADAWWPPLSATIFGFSNGGNWFDQAIQPTASTLTDPKLTAGVQFYADLSNVHHVAPTIEEASTQTGADMFMAGRAAMALTGHWFYPAFSSVEGLNFDVGVFPVGPDGTTPKTDLGSTGLAISSSTQYPTQSWEFLKFAVGPVGQSLIAESGLFVPVLTSVGQSDAFLNSHEKLENTQVFIDAIANSIPLPIMLVWNEYADIWGREMDAVFRGQTSAAEAHAVIDPQVNQLLGG